MSMTKEERREQVADVSARRRANCNGGTFVETPKEESFIRAGKVFVVQGLFHLMVITRSECVPNTTSSLLGNWWFRFGPESNVHDVVPGSVWYTPYRPHFTSSRQSEIQNCPSTTTTCLMKGSEKSDRQGCLVWTNLSSIGAPNFTDAVGFSCYSSLAGVVAGALSIKQ
jgi:hypothetical protein